MAKPTRLQALRSIPLVLFVWAHTAPYAQSNNVLGLPAVPQTPQAPASGASAARAATVPSPAPLPGTPTDAETKSALSGNISLASFYQEGQITVRVGTVKTFVGNAARAQALQAARLVQRDVRLACGKLCKPGLMPAPTIQSNNTLSFDLVINGYAGTLNTVDMVNLVNAKAIGPGGKLVPVPVASPTPLPTPLPVPIPVPLPVPVPVPLTAPAAAATPTATAPSAVPPGASAPH